MREEVIDAAIDLAGVVAEDAGAIVSVALITEVTSLKACPHRNGGAQI
jgi:hypothetical protein